MNSLASVLKNSGLIVLAWLIVFAGIKLGIHGWLGIKVFEVAACVICALLAVRFNAPFGLAILSIMGVSMAVETAIHVVYGIDKVQGFPSHLAVILSVGLGLVLGRFVLTTRATATT